MSAVSLQKSSDIGSIITKVQDDLQHLRVAVARAGEGELDLQALDMAITRTEKGVQAVAEHVLSESHDKVTTLPALRSLRVRSHSEGKSLRDLVDKTARTSPIKKARTISKRHSRPTTTSVPAPLTLTPGQKAQLGHLSRLLSHPSHPVAKETLTEHYGLPSLPPAGPREGKSLPGQVTVGTTIDHLTTLSRAHRRDAMLTPLPISREDAQRGLLSLLERGLIPPAAELVLNPPPVQPRTAHLHSPSEQFARQRVADGADVSTYLAGVKLDSSRPQPITIPTVDRSQANSKEQQARVSVKFLEPPAVIELPKSPPSTPTDKGPLSYKIVIQNGSLVDGLQEYTEFKKAFQKTWKHILAVLQLMEELCINYAIPLAMADGDRVSGLASEHELGLRLSREDLVECLLNARDVEQIVRIPGRRYKGHRGIHAAAAKIQATFRMYTKRREYLEHRRRKWAAGVLSMSWLLFMKMFKVREQLKRTRLTQLESHRQRAKVLRRRWEQMKQAKRVVIHLPSQGHPQPVRAKLEDFQIRQNLQMARMCDVRDPNVEVLYISPVPVGDEVKDYYAKLLAMGPAGESAMERIHIITPDRVKTFARHNMALSSVLMYSPRTVERIRNLTAGKEAYVVPGVLSEDDLVVAEKLGLPVLGSEPEISRLYSTKSGAKRIFKDAEVSMPPGDGDIFSEEQLVDRLASLVANNLMVSRWLFKLQDQVDGRGFAYCDVTAHLECYYWVLRESQRYGEKWRKKWAQEYALKCIVAELPQILSEHARPLDTELHPTWREFLTQFLIEGGIIEGCPPSDSVTPVTVDILIEPTGAIKILSTEDQICSVPYRVWGVSLPQSSVPSSQLLELAQRVASCCRARGIIGHFSVDFVTFIHPKTMQQELWAVDLDIAYSNHLALYQLLSYMTGLKFDWKSGQLLLPGGEQRFAVVTPHLYHTNLSLFHYPVFFQTCKAHHIGYDPKEKQGTVFALVDGQHREHLGMICLQGSLVQAVTACSSNLAIIHQEISTPHMQGNSNFQAACRELDSVADLMHTNQEEEEGDKDGGSENIT